MDYTKLTDEQRTACMRLLGSLHGAIDTMRLSSTCTCDALQQVDLLLVERTNELLASYPAD